MLKMINSLPSPDLLHALAAMGHGDTVERFAFYAAAAFAIVQGVIEA